MDDVFQYKWSAPLIKTPFTDFLNHISNLQYNRECAPYELMLVDCMEAYGSSKGKEKCRLIMKDLHECVFKIKRTRRITLMQRERDRQFKNGERKEHYAEAPPVDTY